MCLSGRCLKPQAMVSRTFLSGKISADLMKSDFSQNSHSMGIHLGATRNDTMPLCPWACFLLPLCGCNQYHFVLAHILVPTYPWHSQATLLQILNTKWGQNRSPLKYIKNLWTTFLSNKVIIWHTAKANTKIDSGNVEQAIRRTVNCN